ncbi:DUF167 domain-containing protein [Hymenobacter arizonensis]|uniref:UPF0235 protein SAMN04515668_3252 n=1 Tax=Hymenobacter arizonensis TaxID=1227077 RepID=A0A1I5ZVU4_HYMAR|nr:DUF167 family protein [Hymenobacter arizonensis]SFQ60609.1 hypothetical protein SAMN04515668_3252 [Hymenobacter arizonensis]
MILHLLAEPSARTNQLLVAADGNVTVRLKAPPQEGQANAVLLGFLAEVFDTSKSRVVLMSGHTAPFKKVELLDVDESQCAEVLARHRTP